MAYSKKIKNHLTNAQMRAMISVKGVCHKICMIERNHFYGYNKKT